MIGTMPLLSPNTGINTKLCSLKYTPKTAVAVEVNDIRILFIPKVMTEPRDAIMMEGTPTP